MDNIDHDDPEYITLYEAFMQRFKEYGFIPETLDEFKEHSKFLDEILKKLGELRKKNAALLKNYNGDAKFARVHKRIREENLERSKKHRAPIISNNDFELAAILNSIKSEIDRKVYDRNDILKKDKYFEQTVLAQITQSLKAHHLDSERDDRLFIENRLAGQYIEQYKATYSVA